MAETIFNILTPPPSPGSPIVDQTNLVEHDIEDHQPMKQRKLAEGCIEASISEFASPVVMADIYRQ